MIPNYELHDGNAIPLLGFGTYKLNGAQIGRAHV